MILLVSAGSVYRVADEHLRVVSQIPIDMNMPLKEFPEKIGSWSGTDMSLTELMIEVAGNDDYIIRKYENPATGQSVVLYIGFSARPSTMKGHKPVNCYPANGWVHDDTSTERVSLASGRSLDCLIHRFHKPSPGTGNIVVLNYYIVDGQYVTNEDAFYGLKYRMVNYTRKTNRYVTQVQISSQMANSVMDAAFEICDVISDFFPEDVSGQ